MRNTKNRVIFFILISICLSLTYGQPSVFSEDLINISPDTIIRAQLRAVNEPVISSKIGGVITHLKLQSGDSFKKGELLIQIDCTTHQTQLALAKVVHAKKKKVSNINNRLNQLGSISELEMTVSSAEVEEAKAAITYNQAIVSKCNTYAPFSGRVGEIFVDQYQYVNEGQPVMQVSENMNLEIEMIVPSFWLKWLTKGYDFKIEMDETGKTYSAAVERITSKVDPVSHTIKVYGTLKKPTSELLPGMSGNVVISQPVSKKTTQPAETIKAQPSPIKKN